MTDVRCQRSGLRILSSDIRHPSSGKRSTRPNGDMFGRVWGSARGWKGGGRADLTLGPCLPCSDIGRAGPAAGSMESAKFFSAKYQGVNMVGLREDQRWPKWR